MAKKIQVTSFGFPRSGFPRSLILALILPMYVFASIPMLFGKDHRVLNPRGSTNEAKSVSDIEIDQVELVGIRAFSKQEIELAIELGAGDKLDRTKIIQTEENLQALYKQHGYERVSIQSRLIRKRGLKNGNDVILSVLEFRVAEGYPTRISEVRFNSESVRSENDRQYWGNLRIKLMEKLHLKAGDVFDQEKLESAKKNVQDLLASENFIGGRVINVNVVKVKSDDLVAIEFIVDLGDKVSFGFRGNRLFPANRLLSMIDEQRSLGFGKDYINAIRLKIEEEYRSMGYANVQIVPLTFEPGGGKERHITYVINEGRRIVFESVHFDGNFILKKSELEENFFASASAIVQHHYYVAKDIQKAAELVIEFMKSKGFLSARLVAVTMLPSSSDKPDMVRLEIELHEGDQTLIHGIEFSGATLFSNEDLRLRLGIAEGQPLNLFRFSEGLDSLKGAYLALGYLSFKILNEGSNEVIKYYYDNREADIKLTFSEGPKYHASHITIEGLSLTREPIVRRELTILEGEILTDPDLAESEARLKRLGLFSSVVFHVIDDPDHVDGKNVRIELVEGTPGTVGWGLGFRNDLGARVFGQVSYSNIGGRNQTLSLLAAVNRRLQDFRFAEGQVQLTYLWPWFLMKEMVFRPSFSVISSEYYSFNANTVSISASVEKRLFKTPNISSILTYSLERIRQFDAYVAPGAIDYDNQTMTIGSITPMLKWDSRNHPLSPTAGWYATVSYELASPLLLSQMQPFPLGYTRFQLRTDYYFQLFETLNCFLSFRSGYEMSTEYPTSDPKSGAIPIIKLFSLGGPGSIRGFKEQEMNLQNQLVRGTASYVNYRFQVDFPFSGSLKIGPFVDAVNLNVDHFSFGNVRYGTGFGLHYQTPVGPVNFDWGFKVNPLLGEDPAEIHLSIGII